MFNKNNDVIQSDSYDSKFIIFSILAMIITHFIVRVKIFDNQLNYEMTEWLIRANLFTYYKEIVLVVIFLVLLFAVLYKAIQLKYKLRVDYVLFGTGLVVIAAFVSASLSPLKNVHVWGLFTRTNGVIAYTSLFLLIYLISNLKVERKHLSILVDALNIASIILVAIGILQFFGFDILSSQWYKQIYTPLKYRDLLDNIYISTVKFFKTKYYVAPSILEQYNYFGAYCSTIFPMITSFALNEKNIGKKILLLLGSVMLFIGVLISNSLGPLVAVFLVLALMPIFMVNKHNYISYAILIVAYTIPSLVINRLTNWIVYNQLYTLTLQLLKSRFMIFAVLAVVTYLLLLVFRKKISKHRYRVVTICIIVVLIIGTTGFIYTLENVVENNMGLLTNRGYIWYYTYELAKERLITGFGPDSLYYYFPQVNIDGDIYMPNTVVDKPHNMYLQLLIDTGLFGVIGFMILLVGLLLKANKAIDIEQDVYNNTYIKALMLVIAAYMLQGIVNDNQLVVQPAVYLIFGIGAALIKDILPNSKQPKIKAK